MSQPTNTKQTAAEFFRKYSDMIAEAETREEEVSEDVRDKEVGAKEKSSSGGTIEKTEKGIKHTSGKKYGGAKDDEAARDNDED